MQVQAPQIVVQYDYNIYMCVVCVMIYVCATRIVLIPVHLAVFDAALWATATKTVKKPLGGKGRTSKKLKIVTWGPNFIF